MSSSAEELWRAAQKIEVPAAFADSAAAFRSGVLTGRADVVELLTKYSSLIAAQLTALQADGKDITKMAGGFEAVIGFVENYLKKMREG